jgi:hypothetical protein
MIAVAIAGITLGIALGRFDIRLALAVIVLVSLFWTFDIAAQARARGKPLDLRDRIHVFLGAIIFVSLGLPAIVAFIALLMGIVYLIFMLLMTYGYRLF